LNGIGRVVLQKEDFIYVIEGQFTLGELEGFGRILIWNKFTPHEIELHVGFWKHQKSAVKG